MSHSVKKASFLQKFIAKSIYFFLKTYTASLRISITGLDKTIQTIQEQQTGIVFAFWHDSILALPALTKIAAHIQPRILISYSKDGDIPSLVAENFSHVKVVRVRHNLRQAALKTSIELLLSNHAIFITPDGPRGPRHKVKEGAIFAAKTAKAPIIPIVLKSAHAIRLRSWDRFIIPLPFSKVTISLLPKVAHDHSEGAALAIFLEKLMEAESSDKKFS